MQIAERDPSTYAIVEGNRCDYIERVKARRSILRVAIFSWQDAAIIPTFETPPEARSDAHRLADVEATAGDKRSRAEVVHLPVFNSCF